MSARSNVPAHARLGANAWPRGGNGAALSVLGIGVLLGAALLSRGASRSSPPARDARRDFVRAGRRMNRAAGTIATSVLIDSAMEHYRGGFENPAMVTPLVTSILTIAASLHGHSDRAPGAHRARDVVYAIAGLTGTVGTAFHIYNVTKRPGGVRWQNVFYGAPLGAPAALSLAGMTGFLAERVRDNTSVTDPDVFGLPAGRVVSAMTGLGLLGTVAEAGLLHFRGGFHNPAMVLPVTVPVAAAGLLGLAASGPDGRPRPLTRWWLRLTALVGVAGVGFHAIGIARRMGGWRNWRQNLLAGPPLPAPPAFSGLALAGLAALGLLEDDPRD